MSLRARVSILPMAVAVALGTWLGTPALAQAPTPEVRITLFHDTHLHGNLEGQDGVTLAHYIGLIRQHRAELPEPTNSVFVGAGDDVGPSLFASVFHGHHTEEALSAGGLDVNTFGNHEFDFGPDNLREVVTGAGYPYVTANVRDVRTGDAFGADIGVRKWLIKQVAGVRFGFTGLAPADTANIANVGPNVAILDPVDAMRQVLPEMRAGGAQVVVLLSHLCGDDTERVAALVDGIDVAVGDHCSRAIEQPRVINGTIVSRRGDELKLLGQIDLYVVNGRVARHTYTQHTVRADGLVDETIASIVERYKQELEDDLNTAIGRANSPLDATRNVVRSEESNAGNLIADALRAWRASDVAIQNGGSIRGARVFGPGVLLKRDVQEMLPFANYAVVLRVSGTDLWAALENGVSQVEQGAGRFPQVSGLSFTWDPAALVGSRIIEVTLSGTPLDLNASYTVATNDFMAAGGDGYEVLQKAEVVVSASAGPLLTNLVIEYIEARGAVAAEVEGRIRKAA